MWQIRPNLHLGDRDDARDLPRLRQRNITHVLNCAEEEPCHHPKHLRYLHLAMRDPDPRFDQLIDRACDFIDAALRKNTGVLVHCSAGISRSAATVLAYLACRGNHPDLPSAARELAARVLTNPDPLFLSQLAHRLRAPTDKHSLTQLTEILLGHSAT
jgi:protein-tyrosine phosphatase